MIACLFIITVCKKTGHVGVIPLQIRVEAIVGIN